MQATDVNPLVSSRPTARPGSLVTDRTRYSVAYGGSSLLSNARRIIRKQRAPNSYELHSLSTWIDALVLHDSMVLLGNPLKDDHDFAKDVNTHLGSEAIRVVSDPGELAPIEELQEHLSRLLETTFDHGAPALTVQSVNERPGRSRRSMTQRKAFIDTCNRLCREAPPGKPSRTSFDFDGFADYLLDEYDRSLIDSGRKPQTNNLYRVFLHAAIAEHLRGTTLAEGLRRIVLSLIEHKQSHRAPITLAKRLYDIADVAYHEVLFSQAGSDSPQPLSLAAEYVLSHAESRRDIPRSLGEARRHLEPFRQSFQRFQTELDDEKTTRRRKHEIQKEILGSGGGYLYRIISELGFGASGLPGFFQKLWANSVGSLLEVPSATYDDKGLTAEVEVEGATILKFAQGLAKTFNAEKQENEVRGILDMVQFLIDKEGLQAHLERLLLREKGASALHPTKLDQIIRYTRLSA